MYVINHFLIAGVFTLVNILLISMMYLFCPKQLYLTHCEVHTVSVERKNAERSAEYILTVVSTTTLFFIISDVVWSKLLHAVLLFDFDSAIKSKSVSRIACGHDIKHCTNGQVFHCCVHNSRELTVILM